MYKRSTYWGKDAIDLSTHTLWHYTSIDSFIKMIDDRVLASHYKFLNDTKEIEFGRKIFDAEMKRYSVFNDYIDDIIKDSDAMDVYLSCFSLANDSLEQWRAYAPEGGVALGFSGDRILKQLSREKDVLCRQRQVVRQDLHKNKATLSFYLEYLLNKLDLPFVDIGQCIYDQNELLASLNSFLSEYSEALEKDCFFIHLNNIKRVFNLNECPKESARCLIIMTLGGLRNFFACCAKHSSFINEREIRIIYYGKNFRDLAKIIGYTPRIETFITPLRDFIDKICISPHGANKKNKLLVEFLCDKYRLDKNIYESNCPYNSRY